MKKLLFLCAAILGMSLLNAKVKPGENILINGSLASEEIDQATGRPFVLPPFWSMQGPGRQVKYNCKGGPDGKGSISFIVPESAEKGREISVRQNPLTLVGNGKYRISAMIRTKNFKCGSAGVCIMDNGWFHTIGLNGFPENQDWKLMTREFTLFTSKDNWYGFLLFTTNYTGTLEIADVKLEALSQDALDGSSQSAIAKKMAAPMLIPWKPLLYNIAATHDGSAPEMTFLFTGNLPNDDPVDKYDVKYSINDQPAMTRKLKKGENTLKLKGLDKLGEFKLSVSIVSKKNGKEILSQTHSAALIDVPATSGKNHKRLNNLVVEILNAPIKNTDSAQKYEFYTMRDGWIFIAAKKAASEKLSIMLDDKLEVINNGTPRLENFRDVSMGRHTLTISGAANGGSIIVRSIPEIFNYCPGANSGVPENKPYDWAFQKKYALHAITTENGGNVPPEVRKEFFAAGYKWIGSIGTTKAKADELLKKLNSASGMNSADQQGVTCDEQFFNSKADSIIPYTEGLKQFVPKDKNHVVYTWITGYPTMSGIDNDFIATCLNTCYSRGRLISEVYIGTKPTEAQAKDHLQMVIVDRVHAYKAYYPNLIDHWGIILGNFNQVPILSLAHHPNVDYKYYLDMQFNILANDPECKNMGITGYWGSYYADNELHRWSFMLTRHYCVEGKKTMLSDEYGFSYAPGHVVNGDFAEAFKGWTVKGNVTEGKHAGYGSRGQNRWGGNNGAGDTFAVLTKKEGETSTVAQTAKKLVPGKNYCLQFFTVDYNDVKADKINPRKYGITATLGKGAEINEAQSWVHVDKRVQGRYAHNNGVARGNLHHIVFKATKPEVSITFDNAKALNGEALGINYVMLSPYLLEK